MDKFEGLKQLIADAEKDVHAFYEKGNKAAGTRLRKYMQIAKDIATRIRKEVTDLKNKAK